MMELRHDGTIETEDTAKYWRKSESKKIPTRISMKMK